ncbi:MAG: Flp pilus assembly complex ATPase component TadA [Planctomycetaceae bacterium]|nr:Flp pilus assembly complex ATPase component TadA [Planctomycetaceae bacterium]
MSEPEPGESLLTWSRRREVAPDIVAQATAEFLQVPYWESLRDQTALPEYVRRFPIGFARQHAVLSVVGEEDQPILVVPGPEAAPQWDVVSRILKTPLRLTFAPRAAILTAVNQAYEQQNSRTDAVIDSISRDEARERINAIEQRDDLLSTDGQAPVIELINLVLLEAVKEGASDVHLQPGREELVVRYRIDGVLFDAHKLPKDLQEEAISRVKIMGNMNIAEKRLPQDGRSTVTVGERTIDMRIASLPGKDGERVVIRLLDKSTQLFTLEGTGMDRKVVEKFRSIIRHEHGLILLTGPTGSGKTTSLYSALQELNQRERNIVTLEDPIEYDIEGISQTQINTKKGMTFASGLRSVLRQDPDIIMVGEIRDEETAVLAIQSSLTGHLVFSTLHTNDSASAVTRLLHFGIEPYLLSSSLLGVLAQRLVRRVCDVCGEWLSPVESLERVEQLGLPPEFARLIKTREGPGCSQCRETGYRGRVAVTELLIVEQKIRKAIQARSTSSEIQDLAREGGMLLLRETGIHNVIAGVTTVEEVLRVTVAES